MTRRITNEPTFIIHCWYDFLNLFLWPVSVIRSQLVFNIWHAIRGSSNHFNYDGGIMTHTMQFNCINDLLAWIVENEFYNLLPVDLTIHLGE